MKRKTNWNHSVAVKSRQTRCCYASKVLPSLMFRTVCMSQGLSSVIISEASRLRLVRDESEKTARVLMTLWLSSVWPGGNTVPTSCSIPVAAQPSARVSQQSCLSSSRINNIMEVTVGGNFVYMVVNCLCVSVCFCVWRKRNCSNEIARFVHLIY